jgi:ACS family hexuronate transporter-like MFS transporter
MLPVTPAVQPEGRRWWILGMLFAAIAINIFDRQVLSLVAPVLREQLHLSNTGYGFILFCFLLGMTVGQLPTGLLLDRKGPRAGFTILLLWWSLASLLHAFSRTVMQFGILRFALGTGESGLYSGGVKVIGQWFPIRERALAGGIFNSGSLLGAIVAPPVITYLILKHGWPAAFWAPSLLGMLWLFPWIAIYRPPSLQLAAPSEVSTGRMVSVPELLRCPSVWGVILMRTFGGPVSHFHWYWLPEYLRSARHMSLETIGLTAWMPFFSGGLGNIGGGWFSSYLIRRGWTVNRARKTAFFLGAFLCLAALLVPLAPGSASALALICVAALGINVIAANLIGLLTDLFPEHLLGRITGLTGVGDGFASMLMMLAAGAVIDRFSFVPVFVVVGLLPLLSIASLLLLVRRIEPVVFKGHVNTLEPVTE